MVSRRRLVVALLVVSTSGCGAGGPIDSTDVESSDPSDPPASSTASESEETALWGESAEAWWDAMGAAAREGTEHLVSFLASDLEWEHRVFDQVTHGEDEWVDLQLALNGGSYPWVDAAMLVSADEVLGSFTTPTFEKVDSLERMVMGPDGIRHWVTALGPVEVCRAHSPWMCEFDVDGLVDRWLALWSGASRIDAESIYAPYAVVSDTLLGEKVSGSDAIADAGRSRSWPAVGAMEVPTISEEWGRAVYLAPRYYDWVEGPEEIRFLVDADDGSGCPGRMGVALALEGESVIWERRYHDVESVRKCFDPSDLAPGWWEGMETPDTMVIEQTGTVSVGDMRIDVYNGIPELDDFVRWGFSRFEQADLPAPRIDSVTFLRARVYCNNLAGHASISTQETSIVLCFQPEEVCVDDTCTSWSERSRHYWLHELAHPWLEEFTDDEVRSEFLDLVSLSTWQDLDDPWHQRGVERGADVLAHTLMDERVTLFPEIHGSCQLRDSGFEILTGSAPLAGCSEYES